MANEEKPQVSTQPILVLAVAVSAIGALMVLTDLFAPGNSIPRTLMSLSLIATATCWNIYIVWTALRRVDQKLRQTLTGDYARGYVDGISRRDPEDARQLIRSVS